MRIKKVTTTNSSLQVRFNENVRKDNIFRGYYFNVILNELVSSYRPRIL